MATKKTTTPELTEEQVALNEAAARNAADVKTAYEAIGFQDEQYTPYFNYYDGDQPLTYTASKLAKIFREIDAYFAENWCSVIVDACSDRVVLKGLTHADKAKSEKLEAAWKANLIGLEASEGHQSALIAGEAFIIVWREDVEASEENAQPQQGQLQVFYNDPRMCYVHYDPANPKRKLWAAKCWEGDDEHKYLTLYYPDRIAKYRSNKKSDQVRDHRAFELQSEEENPFDKVPVFHLRKSLRRTLSDLKNATPIQDAINKLLVDMMVAGEFGAFKQRYAITNADLKGLKNAPNEIWKIPPGDGLGQPVQVGEFSSADLEKYIAAIDSLAMSLSSITRTPKHYFLKQGGDPSGEALIAMEAPLNKKAEKYISHFAPVWSEIGAFILELLGEGEVVPTDITPQFDDPKTVQPVTQATVRQTTVGAGVALRTALRWEGKSKEEVDLAMKEKEEETEANQMRLAEAMKEAETRFSSGEDEKEKEEAKQ